MKKRSIILWGFLFWVAINSIYGNLKANITSPAAIIIDITVAVFIWWVIVKFLFFVYDQIRSKTGKTRPGTSV